VGAPGRAARVAITDGRGVLQAMHARWSGRFYTSLSFAQNTTNISQSGREIRGVWNEYLVVPGRLRIDYLPLSSRSGVLYTGGRIHAFTDGRPQPVQRGWNPLAILVADVYGQPVDTTAMQLDSSGFDLSIAREDRWQNARVWVVGAGAGDSTSSQFWVDGDSLLVRRVIRREVRAGRATVTDVRFYKYQDAGGYPVAFDVHFLRDGRLYFKEEYFDVKPNVAIPPEVFDPAKWSASQVRRGTSR
jgi:hypothetical protein